MLLPTPQGQRSSSGPRALVVRLCILMLFAVAAPGAAAASSFQVSPTLGEVGPDEFSTSFRIRNPGGEPLTVQVTASHWLQEDNEDRFEEAEELILVPPLVTIPPGESQLIRVAHRNRSSAEEEAYRVFFHEVPPAPEPDFQGVRTSLRISLPLFFAPGQGSHALQWTAGIQGTDRLLLHVENRGERFARISVIQLLDGNGETVARIDGPQYVLSGAQRHWRLPANTPALHTDMRIHVEFSSTHEEYPLMLE